MANIEVPLFRNQLVTANSGGDYAESTAMSQTVPVQGNKAVVSVTTVALDASCTLTIYYEASYDGNVWIPITNVVPAAIGYSSMTGSNLAYGFLRVRAHATGTTGKPAVFNASIAFSQQ